MSDEAQNQDKKKDEELTASETMPSDNASNEAKTKPRRRKHPIRSFLLMLLTLAGLAVLAYGYLIMHPGKFKLSNLTKLSFLHKSVDHPTMATPQKAPTIKAPSNTHQSETPAPVIPPETTATTAQTPLGSQQASQLMAAIQQLQDQLQQMHSENEQLRHALDQQQRLDLQSRFRLIADPATRLDQLTLLWQDVSLSPALSTEQRSVAVSMTAAARDALTQNQQWQQRLDRWIVKLSEPESGPDLFPHFAHPWLEWLAEQFHLRPASSSSNGSMALRQKLIRIRKGMMIESWPKTDDWRPIRAELVLINASSTKKNGKPTTLGLPNDFTAIRKAVATLHQTANQWLEANP